MNKLYISYPFNRVSSLMGKKYGPRLRDFIPIETYLVNPHIAFFQYAIQEHRIQQRQ